MFVVGIWLIVNLIGEFLIIVVNVIVEDWNVGVLLLRLLIFMLMFLLYIRLVFIVFWICMVRK